MGRIDLEGTMGSYAHWEIVSFCRSTGADQLSGVHTFHIFADGAILMFATIEVFATNDECFGGGDLYSRGGFSISSHVGPRPPPMLLDTSMVVLLV